MLKGKDLLDKSSIRCSVIPYSMKDNELYFLLGRDNKTREICDFGGGIKKGETIISGAIRELYQESKDILGSKYKNESIFLKSPALHEEKNMSMILLPIESYWIDKAGYSFINKKSRKYAIESCYDEIVEIFWISEKKLFELIEGRDTMNIMWTRISNFLKRNLNDSVIKFLKDQLGTQSYVPIRCTSWQLVQPGKAGAGTDTVQVLPLQSLNKSAASSVVAGFRLPFSNIGSQTG